MKKEILQLLSNNLVKNDIILPYWIYKVENIIVQNRRFLKIYLINRYYNNEKINRAVFVHNGERKICDFFNVVSDYNNENAVGCVLEINLKDSSSDLVVEEEIVGGVEYVSSGNTVEIHYESVSKEKEQYLKSKGLIEVYPQIGDGYWVCSCGRINNYDNCACGKNRESIEGVLNYDYNRNIVDDFLSSNKLDFDLNKSFSDNIDNYYNRFTNSNPLANLESLIERINLEEEEKRYNSLAEERQNTLIQNKKRRTKTISFIAIGAIAACLVFYLYMFTGQNGLYNKAKRLLKNNSFDQAKEIYKSLGEYKNSEEMVIECDYQKALSLYEENMTGSDTISLLASLGDYKDSKQLLHEAKYQQADEYVKKDKISEAIKVLTSIPDYKDSKTKINEAKYKYVKSHFDNNDEQTYSYLQDLVKENYSNAKSLYSDLYDWKIKVICINSDKEDYETNLSTINWSSGIVCFHLELTGGTPGESFEGIEYEMTYLDGSTHYRSIDNNDVFKNSYNEATGCVWHYWWGDYPSGTAYLKIYNSSGRLMCSSSARVVK